MSIEPEKVDLDDEVFVLSGLGPGDASGGAFVRTVEAAGSLPAFPLSLLVEASLELVDRLLAGLVKVVLPTALPPPKPSRLPLRLVVRLVVGD